MATLEHHYRDLCDIEFTVENGKLWMLQTRVGKRTAAAAFRIATQLVDEGVISMDEALGRVSGAGLAELMFPRFDESATAARLATGMGASPGAAVGRVVFDSASGRGSGSKGRSGDPGPHRDQPRRPTRDGGGQGDPHPPWRQDEPRRRRRPGHGQDLCRRRSGTAHRHQGETIYDP